MTEKHEGHTVTTNALVAKRADILFEIGEHEEAELSQLRTELVHLDAVLRMFRPDFKAGGFPSGTAPDEIAVLRTRRVDEADL